MLNGQCWLGSNLVNRHAGCIRSPFHLLVNLSNQGAHLFHAQVQSFGLSADVFELFGADSSVFHDVVKISLQGVALFDQLVAKGGRQNSGRDCEDADSRESHDHRHGPANRRYGVDVTVADGGQRNDRPVNRGRDVFVFVRLRIVFKQVTQRGGHDHQQNHDEGRCADHRPFPRQHLDQGGRGVIAAGQLEQSGQAENPQEPQVNHVVQQAFQEEGQDGQQVDKGRYRGGLLEPAGDGAFEAGLFYAGVHAHHVLDREYPNHNRIQYDELDIQYVTHAVHRLHDYGEHRQQYAHRNKAVEQFLQTPTVSAWEHQGMDFLAQGAAFIGFNKSLVGRNDDAE